MRITDKTKTDLKPKNNTIEQTPIEIALQIDENGMTTLKALYSFLQLDQSHYKRWYNKNIINNDFANENIDYVIIRPNGENSKVGRSTLDFKLTSDFAKQLSMTVKNERGQQARQYFIACEQGLKIAANKLKSNETNIQPLVDAITALTNTVTTMQSDIQQLKQSQPKLTQKKYSRWKSKTFEKLRLLQEYINTNSDQDLGLNNVINLVIKETEDIYNVDISEHTDMYKEIFGIEGNPYVLDVISYWKDIKEQFVLTLDSDLERLGITYGNDDYKENIIDILARKREVNTSDQTK